MNFSKSEDTVDGANNISGIYGGLQTLIQEQASNTNYRHCVAHALN